MVIPHVKQGDETMEIVKTKCENCNKEIYVNKINYKEPLFCTLSCMSMYQKEMMETLT